MKIIKPLVILMGVSTLLGFNSVNPIHGQNLTTPSDNQEKISLTTANINHLENQLILAGHYQRRPNSRYYDRGGYYNYNNRRNQRVIIVPSNGNINLYNGNLRRNNTYWNNNGYYNNGYNYPRNSYEDHIRYNQNYQRSRDYRRIERQCTHRAFTSAWGGIRCRNTNPSVEWRNIYFE
ncbi:hypothetical protein IQ215_06355 [Cyanobacterium stanieri LEGE 03274]|uniref:Secreted protein n=1 Tax=Cyanobacterium stanieri LEGE 03274 TaxID=1828756 RepID=A0ABR9V342_9CHRO|nr:hypothetical protein [Cyanobacterium stanieri]MBE9222315.1 hypothetical protein [Cyanobacterium stanieri LEGE 03274]